jgi:hypothetical protein
MIGPLVPLPEIVSPDLRELPPAVDADIPWQADEWRRRPRRFSPNASLDADSGHYG